jgi:transposase-like protein
MGILSELKNRGVNDILVASVDDLTGFPDAINAVFPNTEVQLCIVHMVRNLFWE